MNKKYYDTKDFKKLQAEWYGKLRERGFDDVEVYPIERYSDKMQKKYTQNLVSPYLKRGDAAFYAQKSPETALFYQILTNYQTHTRQKTRIHGDMLRLFIAGKTYRQITKAIQSKYTPEQAGKILSRIFKRSRKTHKLSIFFVHTHLKRTIERALEWNRTDPRGYCARAEQTLQDLESPDPESIDSIDLMEYCSD